LKLKKGQTLRGHQASSVWSAWMNNPASSHRRCMTPAEWQIVAFTAGMAVLSTALILGRASRWRGVWRGSAGAANRCGNGGRPPLVLRRWSPAGSAEIVWPRGPLGHWLYSEFHLDIVFTWRAVALALAVMSFPLLVRTARAAMRR